MKIIRPAFIIAFLLAINSLLAQDPGGVQQETALIPFSSKQLTVTKGSSSSIQVNLDPAASASDALDLISSDPAVVIAITTPAGFQINASTAAANGFQWQTLNVLPGTSRGPGILDFSGTHTVISLPPGSAAGPYLVSADATNASADCVVLINYLSTSAVKAALISAPSPFVTGKQIVLSGIVLDGAIPVAGATASVKIVPEIVATQVTISGYSLVSSTAVDAETTADTYAVLSINNGSAVKSVTASLNLEMVPAGSEIDTSTVSFGDIPAGATVPSLDSFTVTHGNSAQFNPNSLQWQIRAAGSVTQMALSDSGPYDAQSGDGVYSGAFTPTVPGRYAAVLEATGSSNSGVPFSRTAASTFVVTAPLASFNSIQSAWQTDPDSGLVEQLTATATMTVQTAGSYDFSISLEAGNGSVLQQTVSANLGIGGQTLIIAFPANKLYELGVDGPYQLQTAQLWFNDPFDRALADSRDQVGPTPAVQLTSFDRGPIYLTGQNAASGVTNGGTGSFDSLQISMGVFTSGGYCRWEGNLEDAAGNLIDGFSKYDTLPAGTGLIQLHFDGQKIAQAGINGPLVIERVTVSCPGADGLGEQSFQTQAFQTQTFSSAQFSNYSNGPVTFAPAAASVVIGSSTDVQIARVGPLSASDITLTVSGAPSGVTAQLDFADLCANCVVKMTLTASSAVVPGLYPITIQASGASFNQTFIYALTVTQNPIAVAVTPANPTLSAGQTQQFTAAVSNSGNQSVAWSITPSSLGTISATGRYSAPSTITEAVTVTVTAASAVDTSKSATAKIYLQTIPPLAASSQTVTINPGGTNSVTFSRNSTATYSDTAFFSVRGLPAGVTAAFTPDSITGTGSTSLTISVPAGFAPGTYGLLVAGTGIGLIQTSPLTLIVPGTGNGNSSLVLQSSEATLLAQPGAITATTLTLGGNGVNSDTFVLSVSGLPADATAAFSPNSLSAPGSAALTLYLAGGVAAGSYPLTVTATGSMAAQATVLSLVVSPIAGAGALPAGWNSVDVGPVGVAGQVAYGGGVYRLLGTGNDFEPGTSDEFRFVYAGLTGDGSIVARLVDTGDSNAGIMIRDTLDPLSRFAALTQGARGFSHRTTTGSYVSQDESAAIETPAWLKLTRAGNIITAYTSSDGVNWSAIGNPLSVSLNSAVYAGLFVSAWTEGDLVSGTFDNVRVTGSGGSTQLQFGAGPVSVVAGAAMAPVTVRILDSNGNLNNGANNSVTLTSSPAGVSRTAAAVSGVATFNNLVFNTPGNYTLTAGASGFASITSGSFSVGAAASAVFVAADTGTQGNWVGAYGADGYSISNGASSLPSYASLTFTGGSFYTWAASSTEARALLQTPTSSDRIASTYYSPTSFTIDLNLTDGQPHQVALYFLDFDDVRAETISILDASNNAVLDSRSLSNFHDGRYLVWNLSGHVLIRVTRTGGLNAVISGLFFTPAPSGSSATAVFTGADTATQGNWVNTYGGDGYTIANGDTSLPSYAAVNLSAANAYTWASSTTETRALWKNPSMSGRIVSAYYSDTTFMIDVNLTDNQPHRVALYALAYDADRSETLSILDASTNALLDNRVLAGFENGQYLTWNIKGHVLIRVTRTGGLNAVVSGLFFGPVPSGLPSPPTVAITNPTTGQTVSGIVAVTANASSAGGSIASVQVQLDGVNLGAPVTSGSSGSYSYQWASGTAGNGSHQLTAIATDSASQTTTSAGVTLTVANAANSASFIMADTATLGNWKGIYGADGEIIANDSNVQPSYGSAAFTQGTPFTWVASLTDDARPLLKAASQTDHIASTYYDASVVILDVHFTDASTHRVALYLLDFDTSGRAETVSVLDAATNAVLDTRSASSFVNGEYLVWNISGHVTIQVARTGGPNAVVSGVCFGPVP